MSVRVGHAWASRHEWWRVRGAAGRTPTTTARRLTHRRLWRLPTPCRRATGDDTSIAGELRFRAAVPFDGPVPASTSHHISSVVAAQVRVLEYRRTPARTHVLCHAVPLWERAGVVGGQHSREYAVPFLPADARSLHGACKCQRRRCTSGL